MTVTLDTINTAAADLIERVGWVQGTWRDAAGRVCLTGALRHCDPRPGDSHLAHVAYRRLGHSTAWNDTLQRTAGEVVAWLRATPVTSELLAVTYGPQWQQVAALVRRAAVLTADETEALASTRDWTARYFPAEPEGSAGRFAADAAWHAAVVSAGHSVADIAADAACALAARDLLLATPDGTLHYRALIRTWTGIVGPVHPDDEPVTA